MSQSHDSHEAHDRESWLETWWPLLVIVFGVSLFSVFILWHPFTV